MTKIVYQSTNAIGVTYYESETKRHKGRPDKCYYIRYKINGQLKREKVGWASEGYSVALASQTRNERLSTARGRGDGTPDITVSAAIEKYKEYTKTHNKSWEEDWQRVASFDQMYGSMYLSEIRPSHIDTYLNTLRQKKIKKRNKATGDISEVFITESTVKHYLTIIKRMFSYLTELEMYDRINPTKAVKIKKYDNTIVACLTDEELERFISVCSSGKYKMQGGELMLFALYTGLRRSSIFRMKWCDVDINKQTYTLTDQKNSKVTTIYMSGKAVEILKRLRKPNKHDALIFPGPEGRERQDVRTLWERVKKDADIRPQFRFHDLRHNFATMLREEGVDLDVVSKMLSHSSVTVTQRYAHIKDRRLQSAAQAVDAMFSRGGVEASGGLADKQKATNSNFNDEHEDT